MLELLTSGGSATRREFLQVGTLALGGLTLAQTLAARAAGASTEDAVRDKAVVVLFLAGGPSHIETFNPNMDAPAPYHSLTGQTATTVPGLSFGGTFPLLAQHAKKMAIVRSLQHSVGSHPQAIAHMLSGGNPTGASIGSIYSRLRGANHPETGMPSNSMVSAPEVDSQYRTEKGRVKNGSSPGTLGPAYAPFDPADGGQVLKNMQLAIPRGRFDDRRALLSALDSMKRQVESSDALAGADKFTSQAYDLILGGATEAFDLSQEDPRLVERYNTSQFRIGHKSFRKSNLGQQMLMARRLVEAGCGFVTVQAAGWDMHADGNNPGIEKGMEMLGRPVDKAVSACLEDLEQRGMSDRVLLIITGDFGRTPKVNTRGGRDHWANLCTLALAGGGICQGQVIGQAGRNNDVPSSDPLTPGHLLSTVLHYLFDLGTLRVLRGVPRDLLALAENGTPIPGLTS